MLPNIFFIIFRIKNKSSGIKGRIVYLSIVFIKNIIPFLNLRNKVLIRGVFRLLYNS
jgi:hypothetical protein